MLLLNIGSKYIELKISDTQAEYIRNEIGREILIFSMVFIGTKDIILSIIVTAAFIILANTVFHEESNYCMMPEKYKKQNVMEYWCHVRSIERRHGQSHRSLQRT